MRNTPFLPFSDLTLPKGASTSLSGPIREVEREVDAAQARAQKKTDFSLRSFVSTSRRHKCLVSPASFFHLTRGADGKKQCEREKQQKLGGNDRTLATNTVCMRSSSFGNGPCPPNGGRTPRSTFVAPQDARRTPRSTLALKMNVDRTVLRSWPPKIM